MIQAWRFAQATCVLGFAVLAFSQPGLAQNNVAGACGYLPLPPQLKGKQVVLAIPANKTEPNPCGPGSVVAYTLVDGQQLFLPVATANAAPPAPAAVPARPVAMPPQTLATDLNSLATAPDRDDPFTLQLAKAWDIGPTELLAEDRRKTALRAARVSERRIEISAAATAGDAVAQWLTGLDLIDRGTSSLDFQAAASILEKSADQGFAPAQYHLAMLHYQAQGLPFDKAKLIGLLAAASAAGDAQAQRVAASLIQSGTYVKQDADLAKAIEARLAERGFLPAVINRIVNRSSPATGAADILELKRLSDMGSWAAAAMLSKAYLLGWNVPKDKLLAVSFAELAAQRGDIGALDVAADYYRSGKGPDKDKALAAQLDAKYFPMILASAQKGHALDQVRVADAYAVGHGVRRDTDAWRAWIEKAKAAGLPDARETVARAQQGGLAGYARNCPTAMSELAALSREGYYSADLVIGWDYVMGHCNNKDLYMARQHFERIDRMGNAAERTSVQSSLNYIRGQGLSPKQAGGGFLDVITQVAPVMIGALNDATADIAAQRQEAAAQQARADQQYQSAMAAAQARQRQAGAESAAAAAERDARNASSEQVRQNALARQRAALAQVQQQQTIVANTATSTIGVATGSTNGRQPRIAANPGQPRRSFPAVIEALSGCQARGAGRFVCWTSSSGLGNAVGPNEASGWRTPEEWVDFVGQCPNRGGAINLNDGSVVWTCGYGQSGNHRIDVAAKIGAQVQGRRTFYCDQSEVFCSRTSPEG